MCSDLFLQCGCTHRRARIRMRMEVWMRVHALLMEVCVCVCVCVCMSIARSQGLKAGDHLSAYSCESTVVGVGGLTCTVHVMASSPVRTPC